MNIKKTKEKSLYRTAAIVVCIAVIIALCILFFTQQTPPARSSSVQEKSTSSKNKPVKKSALQTFNTKLYSIDTPGSLWWVVNKNRPAGKEYLPPQLIAPSVILNTAKSSQENSLRPETATAVEKLFTSAQQTGHRYMLASGYRSYALQSTYYNNYVATSGQAEADRYSARPGTSEHQTGLSLDVSTTDRIHYLNQAFGQDPAGVWLAEHAHEYGFIIRYPKGKEAVTGYMYEPWHIRYVGSELAKELFNTNKTMEEFFNL